MERRQRLRLLRPPGRVGEQSKRGSRGQHAGATPAAELHGLYQHAYAPAGAGAAEVGRQAHPTRPESPDAADLGSCESVRPFRTRYECPAAARMIQMAPGDTTVGSTPISPAKCLLSPEKECCLHRAEKRTIFQPLLV